MKTALRVICGIIGFPCVVACAIAVLTIPLALLIVLSVIGLMVWIQYAAIASLFGCVEFAFDGSTSIFKCIGKHFVLAIDWHNGWPSIVMIYEGVVKDACKGVKDAWKCQRYDKAINAMKCKEEDKQ